MTKEDKEIAIAELQAAAEEFQASLWKFEADVDGLDTVDIDETIMSMHRMVFACAEELGVEV